MSKQTKLSEAEDDPESYESSEEEYVEPEKKTNKRRATKKPAAKKAKKEVSSEVDESSDSGSDESLPKSKNGALKNKKTPKVGSFVICKQDAQVGDPNKHPWIWRVDGKSLLQKFEPFEDDGKIKHKSTSIYTGWSPMDVDEYAPLNVDLIEQSEGEVVVELHWDELKKIIQNDSE